MTIEVAHRVPNDKMALGLIRAEAVSGGEAVPELVAAIEACLDRRRGPPNERDESLRLASRDMLRNGRYKPTGRGKPASEYLLRSAVAGDFPRISHLVDAINLVSLSALVPISLWDLDRAGTDRFEFRLGGSDERYVFNRSGQELALADLVCGCGLSADGSSTPRVTPIKDSMATKVQGDTRRVVACIYFPLAAGTRDDLAGLDDELLGWLRRCGDAVQGATAVAGPGEEVRL